MTELTQGADRSEGEATSARGEVRGRFRGFTVLDGVAIVIAAAVASLHLRTTVIRGAGAGWGMLWLTFAGMAITTAGPILLIIRWIGRRPEGYPRLGDKLWAILGLPWIVAAPLRSSRVTSPPGTISLYGTVLTMSVGLVSLIVLVVMWKVWVLKPPGSRATGPGSVPWTERVGMALAVAWPLQSAFLLIVLDSETMPQAL